MDKTNDTIRAIKMVNDNHRRVQEEMKRKKQISQQTLYGSKEQMKNAAQKAKSPSYRKLVANLLSAGLVIAGVMAIYESNKKDTYIPESTTAVEHIQFAKNIPYLSTLDDFFVNYTESEIEEMKFFENAIIQYSRLKEQRSISSEQKQELEKYATQIQDYYNDNSNRVNSKMLSFVKSAILDSHNKTFSSDELSIFDIRFSNVSIGNYTAAKIKSSKLNYKEAPDIYKAGLAIVSLQNGNTRVEHIVDAYSKCATVYDNRENLSMEKDSNGHYIISQREIEKEDDNER